MIRRGNSNWLPAQLLLILLIVLGGPLVASAQYYDEIPEIPVINEDGAGLYVPEGYQPPPSDIPLDEPDYSSSYGEEEPTSDEGYNSNEPGYDATLPGETFDDPSDTPLPVSDPGIIDETPVVETDPAPTQPVEAIDPLSAIGEESNPANGRISEDSTTAPEATSPVDDFGIAVDPPIATASGRIQDGSALSTVTTPPPTRAEDAVSAAGGDLSAEKLFETGTTLFNAKKYDEALENFNKAIALDPANDVYKLALEMVQATIQSEKETPSPQVPDEATKPASTETATSEAAAESGVLMLGDKVPERMAPLVPTEKKPDKPRGKARMVNLTLDFNESGGEGKLHFWKGRRCTLEDDGGGFVATLASGKGFSDMAIGFTVPGEPIKAIAILTHAATGKARSIYPLRISVNKDEQLDGTYQLGKDYREHRFDITKAVVEGINTMRLSIEQAVGPYRLERAVIFLQYRD